MKKTPAVETFATKAEMILNLLKQGKKNPEIKKSVMEVFATCYSSEIDRLKSKVAATDTTAAA